MQNSSSLDFDSASYSGKYGTSTPTLNKIGGKGNNFRAGNYYANVPQRMRSRAGGKRTKKYIKKRKNIKTRKPRRKC
jgi:hypothetical protein